MDHRRVARLYQQAGAGRWDLPLDAFAEALDASAAHAFKTRERTHDAVDRYLGSLHLADLALACACTRGHEEAWEAFVRDYRPVLYRAADALDPGGSAREVADALYADLYERRLLTYFHARSSLATWLRAVLAQRYVDRVRAARRLEPLGDDATAEFPASASVAAVADPDRARLFPLLVQALRAALGNLAARDRLRLQCYYSQELTLAETGRLFGEHEATVSRQLARARRAVRNGVEQYLRAEARLSDAEIAACFETALADPGSLDVEHLLGRKNSPADRST